MLHLIPGPIARALLPVAHRLRHRLRIWRGTKLEGCSIIVTDFEDRVLLLRHSYGPKVWALPGGGMDRGEAPIDCARREVAEEVGIALAQLEPLGTLEEHLSGSPHVAHLFHGTSGDAPVPDMREIVEAKFFPVHSLPEPLGDLTRRRLAAWQERR